MPINLPCPNNIYYNNIECENMPVDYERCWLSKTDIIISWHFLHAQSSRMCWMGEFCYVANMRRKWGVFSSSTVVVTLSEGRIDQYQQVLDYCDEFTPWYSPGNWNNPWGWRLMSDFEIPHIVERAMQALVIISSYGITLWMTQGRHRCTQSMRKTRHLYWLGRYMAGIQHRGTICHEWRTNGIDKVCPLLSIGGVDIKCLAAW